MWHYIALGALLAGLFGGWQIRDWKAGADDRDRAEQSAREGARRLEHASMQSSTYEGQRAANATRARSVAPAIERIVVRQSGDCLDDDGLRVLTDEITRAGTTGQPRPALPAASTPSK